MKPYITRRINDSIHLVTQDLQRDLQRDLQQRLQPLHHINPWMGLSRFLILGSLFLTAVMMAWRVDSIESFMLWTTMAGIFYGFWLICTHDTTHQTLTGWRAFDTIAPRLMSWPMFCPYSCYAQLHKLHHAWNGVNLNDPERVQWTLEDYQNARPVVRWYVRHQSIIDIFILGGIGLIIRTWTQALKKWSNLPHIKVNFWLDVTGIILIQSTFLSLAFLGHKLLQYLLFWLILERAIGIIVQVREHLEHYGTWDPQHHYTLTQLYSSRNLTTVPVIDWLMGGLPYHAIHHAFPGIPFHQLPQAFTVVQNTLSEYKFPPLKTGKGYLQETLILRQHPLLITCQNTHQYTHQSPSNLSVSRGVTDS
jgi:fatty acid desaturase